MTWKDIHNDNKLTRREFFVGLIATGIAASIPLAPGLKAAISQQTFVGSVGTSYQITATVIDRTFDPPKAEVFKLFHLSPTFTETEKRLKRALIYDLYPPIERKSKEIHFGQPIPLERKIQDGEI